MKKIKWLPLLCAALMAAQFMAGCTAEPSPESKADSGVSSQDGPLVKYEEPVVITVGKNVNPNDNSLVDGDTVENNQYTRYLKDTLNIEVQVDWQASGEAYDQKVNLAIASGDIPDILMTSYLNLKSAARAELLTDLTDIYDQYASPLVKSLYENGNNMALESAKVDNRLYAIPSQPAQGNDTVVTWVRKDWMDKANLTEPKTVEDIEKIVKVFQEGDFDGNGKADTIGIVGLTVDPANINTSFSNIYGSFNAYPNFWVEKDGKIDYGSIQPEMKEALTLMNRWYQEGILDKEYAVRKDASELVASGRSGIFFSPWWAPWNCLTDNVKNFTDAEWIAYSAPKDKNGDFTYSVRNVASTYVMVSAECENPEAALKCVNLEVEQTRGTGYEDFDPKGEHPDYWPLRCPISPATEIEDYSKSVRENLKRESIPEEEKAKWDSWYTTVFESAVKDKSDMATWGNGACFTIGAQPFADNPIKKVYNQYYGVTDTMQGPKWTYLQKLETETIDKIIMGEQPIEYFDQFVKDWLANGGQDILNEINEELGK